MLEKTHNNKGQALFSGTMEDIVLVTAWVRGVLYAQYGAKEGEEQFKSLSAKTAIEMYMAAHTNGEA